MSEPTDRDPGPAGDAEWLIADEPAPDVVASHAPGRRTALAAVGLVAAGALVGGVAISAVRSHTSDTTTTTASQTGLGDEQVPDGRLPGGQLPGGQLPGGRGGVDGEQRLSGTVTAVSASSVTIRTSSGATAYAVTAQTEIVRNGAVASLSAVRVGDNVFVHLIPASGSSYVVERLFAQAGSGSTSNDDDANGSTT